MPTATKQIESLSQSIYDTLWATGKFKTGTPFARAEVGARPAFQVWWDGFTSNQDVRTEPGPALIIHKFQIDIYSVLSADARDSHKRLWDLVEVAMDALKANRRLDGHCLRSRVTSGNADVLTDGNPMLAISLVLEADCIGG